MAALREVIKHFKTVSDDYEQRSRNDCLVVHGIPEPVEVEREDTDLLVCDNVSDELGVPLDVTDIKRSHMLGPRKTQTQRKLRASRSTSTPPPRPIIFRLQAFRKR